jgi:hypothetical protein
MELAIPLIALGGMYIISNQKEDNKKKQIMRENFETAGQYTNYLPNTNIPPQNYPVLVEKEVIDVTNHYANPNTATDKYFNQNSYENKNNQGTNVGNDIQDIYSLTGNYVDKSDFKHNNMVPFYGAKIKGHVYGENMAETILDNMVGSGSQVIKKIEQAPLFKPQENINYAYGAPNMSDFYQSRVNPAMKNNNIKPFETENVGPGLNQGFTTNGSNGYNSGMEARDLWLDKTVDQLRVATNPKIEYSLENHQGPSYSHVQNSGILGKVEKFHPDTFFIQNQDRWLTTTGQEKAQMIRSVQEVHPTARNATTTSYSGVAANASKNASYAMSNFETPKREELAVCDVPASNAANRGPKTDLENAFHSHTNYVNNRASIRQPDTYRSGFSGTIGAIVAPLMDFLKPTRKEEYVSSIRIYGDAGSQLGRSKGYVYNPQDVTTTTIKETTIYSPNSYIGNQKLAGRPDQQSVQNQRDTTNKSYTGVAGNDWGSMSREAEQNQINNESKQVLVEGRTNHGNIQIYNEEMNITTNKVEGDVYNQREFGNISTYLTQTPMTKEQYGQIRSKQSYNQCIGCDRIEPSILDAFRASPYTHSLTDCV